MSPTPAPITTWGHVWRIALVLLISAIAWAQLAEYQWRHVRWWFWLDLALGVASFVAMFWRRRHPVPVALVTNLAASFSMTSAGPGTLTLFSLATRRRWREIIPVSIAAIGSAVAYEVWCDPTTGPDNPLAVELGFLVTAVAVTIGWGMYIGSRRELLAPLRERAETAESEQAARVAQARIAERARIAREMHDVLAHRISTVTMHAGALAFRDDLAADEVRRAARVIESNSRLALVELRQVLGVLREDPGDAAPEPPQPTATSIESLVEQFRTAGMNLQWTPQVDPSAIPDTIGRTAYRTVQEGLTNAAKHAPRTRVDVTMSGGPQDGLLIEVANRIPAGAPERTAIPASGLGLVGLAERAQLAGGRLTRSVTADRHVLRVWLPWTT